MTGISVGGVATGLTSGTFYVQAGSSITLTYSAAPTWTWAAIPSAGVVGQSVPVANPAPVGGQLGTLPQILFPIGTTIFADSAAIPAGTPGSGAQQLYVALNGATNLRAYVQGQDDVGHAALSN